MNKEHILKEIRRTTEANGGAPLGSRRFATETGIQEKVWLGRYWGRWGDALTEAGFSPNQLKGAYEKEFLLELCANLTRELGRLPTANDLRMKDRTDPKFPNQKVFERLGTKAELVKLLLAYCREHEKHSDIIGLCEGYAPRTKAEAPQAATAQVGDDSFVYLVKSGRFFKIGRSNSVGRRSYELNIQLPERAEVVHEIRTDDSPGIEAYWHNRFAAKRKNGEWFELDATDIAAFKRRKFM